MKEFETRKDAVKAMENMNLKEFKKNRFCFDGIYYLSHGEYSSPEFSIRKKGAKYCIRRYNYFYENTYNAPAKAEWL
jgi:hypothetical protein